MNSDIITQKGERLSFYQLFAEFRYRIVIPIIQREYAQGRTGNRATEVRSQFLNALYDYLEEDIPFRDLDFIYGNLSTDETGICFIPLDGQQRLTTLFLLHRYLYLISNDVHSKQEYLKNVVLEGKSLFTYKTRQSASDFCDALMTNDIDLSELRQDENGKQSLSLTIKNQHWFFRSWVLDPTVCSMLVMLEAIHVKFQGKHDYFARLIDLNNPIITFLFMNLKKYRLTDELYIKMNSRGKQLTSFENFKAQYGKYLETLESEQDFKLSFNGKETSLPLQKYFSHRIDTCWTDMLWSCRDIDGETNYNLFDQKIANFIRTIFTFHYVTTNYDSTNLKALREKELPSFNRYRELGVLTKESTLFLIDAFDILYAHIGNSGKLELLSQKHPFHESKTFENSLRYKFENYAEQICFYAYLKYLIRYGCNGNFADWIRVVYNLSHPNNTITNTQEEFASAIRSIDKMLPIADHIIDYLSSDKNVEISYFSSWQVKEEKIKACLILRNENWRIAILKTEQHGYFTGQIGFILSFAGITEFYKCQANCNWNEDEDKLFFESFSMYAEKSSVVFANSYDKRINNKNYCFERAVLTKGDYLSEASANRWNLLSSSSSRNNIPRDYSWRRLLRLDDSSNQQKQLWVKAVFDDMRFDALYPTESLEKICKDGATEMWRNEFVRQSKLFDYSQQGFITFINDTSIMLLKESQMNHNHVELFTYALWINYIENEERLLSNELYYSSSRRCEDIPCVFFKIRSGKTDYNLQITSEVKDYRLVTFIIDFWKATGRNKRIEDYNLDVIEILKINKFNWDNETCEFRKKMKSHKDIVTLLHLLSIELS